MPSMPPTQLHGFTLNKVCPHPDCNKKIRDTSTCCLDHYKMLPRGFRVAMRWFKNYPEAIVAISLDLWSSKATSGGS